MKKLVMFFFAIILVAGYGCVKPSSEIQEMQEEPKQAEIQDQPTEEEIQPEIKEEIKEEPIIKEEAAVAKPETVAEQKKEFQIFSPVLAYEGAYNGPLYGTSEQVGSASMDSYFENLDRNGINFFIGMFGISGEPSADTLISDQGLGEVIDAAQKHPYRIIPFFNPGIGGEEVGQYLGETLTGWYKETLAASQ